MDLSWVKREGDVLYLQQSFRQPIALLIASSQLLRVFMIFMQMAAGTGWGRGMGGTNEIQSLPDLKETALWALGLVQHLLLCGKGIPLNPHSLSVRQKLLFQ